MKIANMSKASQRLPPNGTELTSPQTVNRSFGCNSAIFIDVELGKKIAKDNAKQKIWALEGYALRNKLAA